MKNLAILIAIMGLLSFDLSARKLKITRSGSKDGQHYDYVSQEPGSLFKPDKLVCRNPGAIACNWVKTGTNDENQAIISEIHNEVYSLIMGGSTGGSISSNGYSGTWTGSINEWGQVDYVFEGEIFE